MYKNCLTFDKVHDKMNTGASPQPGFMSSAFALRVEIGPKLDPLQHPLCDIVICQSAALSQSWRKQTASVVLAAESI